MLVFIHDAINLAKRSSVGKIYAVLAILVIIDFQIEPIYPKLF